MTNVRVSRNEVRMDTYGSEPARPHPTFPQWSQWNVYPYHFYGNMRKFKSRRVYSMVTLENEYLRVGVAPDVGGRVWDVYDKIGKRHVINFNPEVHTYNAGFGLNYTSAGMECNYPLAHSCTTSRPREVSSRRNDDGSASIICSELDLIWRTRWSVTYTLYPGRSLLELKVRIYNRTPHESRYMYWCNCGIYVTPDTRFIFPEDEAAMHGQENQTFSWPIWQHRDLGHFKQVPGEMLGLYFLNPHEPFFGCYNNDESNGLVHYADLADLPGKKYWTWGTNPAYCRQLRDVHHGLRKIYGEIQSGRILIQEHRDLLPPETECEWKEIWYPVRGTGVFNGAGAGAALRAEVTRATAQKSTLHIAAMGNGRFPRAWMTVESDGIPPLRRPFPLNPERATETTVVLNGLAGPAQHTRVTLRDESGATLAVCRLRTPNTRDSWREVSVHDKPVEFVGPEHLFYEAERAARDWSNHDLRPLYEKVLALDPGHVAAQRELGKLAVWQGHFGDAAKRFEVARTRDRGALDLLYYQGVACLLAGDLDTARRRFESSNRYDYEARSLARLAELCMREGDYHHALDYLSRLRQAHPRLTRPMGLRAACLRRVGKRVEAAEAISQALAVDGQDPFLQLESMFTRAGSCRSDRLPRQAVRGLLEQVRHAEAPLLEAAFDYMAAGLFDEAVCVARLTPNAGPSTLLVEAYGLARLGRDSQAARALRRACRQDVVGHPTWHLEMFDILDWAIRQSPDSARLHYLLGDLLMARRRTEEGRNQWLEAVRLGEKHWLLYANLGYYCDRVTKDKPQALQWFRKAEKANGADLYVKDDTAAILNATEGPKAAIRYLEARAPKVLASPKLSHTLLTAYLARNSYRKFDALCRRVDFRHNWQIAGPHTVWLQRHFQEAVQLMRDRRHKRALTILEGMGRAPANLGYHNCRLEEEDRRYYHMGCCYEALGRGDEARRCWEKALAVPHYTGYEHAYWYLEWSRRYFQAVALQKLGRANEANAHFDAMEAVTHTNVIPAAARQNLLALVERGRFAAPDEKDSAVSAWKVQTRAEE